MTSRALRKDMRCDATKEKADSMGDNPCFAWIMDDSAPRSEALWDREILRTEMFVAVPSACSLVAGWALIVPRRPMLNLS